MLFFDIDNTLLRSGNKVHERAFDVAIKEVFGMDVRISDYDWTGKIDNQIITEMLGMKGVAEKEVRPRLFETTSRMAAYFMKHHQEFVSELMPGVPEILTILRDEGFGLGLLTGNVEAIGWKKVEEAGIRQYFESGAFGDMAMVRSDLVEIGARRVGVGVEDCVVVGDSPRDIECAKQAGVRVVAVGAGSYGVEELAAFDPDLVVGSLLEKERIIGFLRQ